MRAREINSFKTLLLEQRTDLLNKMVAFRAETLSPVGERGDEGDRATSELDLNRAVRDQERANMLLPKIDRALQRITDGSYGHCEDCGEQIGLARLRARPVATLCIACKEEQEQQERVFA
ncbi:MAG: TraR/DksA C4-type zinc finger protein [Bdellovibrionales bacterium]|nr:TraR/DksA C4-type zinc finger protein [Bdellovibrionales bacterium]